MVIKTRGFCLALALAVMLAAWGWGAAQMTAYAGEENGIKENSEKESSVDESSVSKSSVKENAREVVLTLGSKEALLNDDPYQLDIAPVLVNDTTFLPVRFVAEKVLGATVVWDQDSRTVEFSKNDIEVVLSLETGQAAVDFELVELSHPPFIREGRTLVPLRFLAENLDMDISFDALEKTITITETAGGEAPEPVNLPPVITSLGLQRDTIKIGEKPEYYYAYDNEPGEPIIAQEWGYRLAGTTDRVIEGQPRAFFQPGEYELSLRIQDAAGNWSETGSTGFIVSEEKLVSEMAFKFSDLIYGEMYENVENINFHTLPPAENVTFEQTGPALHLSNSPEVVTQPGVLYRSEARGDFRLMYHHLNRSHQSQHLYVIAENKGAFPVNLKTIKSGVGGPTEDYMNLGQIVALRYLESKTSSTVTIEPGEKAILNQGLRHLNYNEAVTGMQDLRADGPIIISVVMGPEKAPEPDPKPQPVRKLPVPKPDLKPESGDQQLPEKDAVKDARKNDVDIIVEEGDVPAEPEPPVKTPEEIMQEKINYLLSLPVLPSTSSQVRGLFPAADCVVNIRAGDGEMKKVVLGMEVPGYDSWTSGADPLTGNQVKNVGNYGMLYHINISAAAKTGVLFNPRGSIFKGAFLAPDGKVYKVPQTSFFLSLKRAAIMGVLNKSSSAEYVYTPPSGSDTPVILALIPEGLWE